MKQYYITFKVKANPYSRQKTGGSKYYMVKCKSLEQSEEVKNALGKMDGVSNIRASSTTRRPDMAFRIVLDADAWLNSTNE